MLVLKGHVGLHRTVKLHLLPGPDILECEVKWALESVTMKKANEIPADLFQILKDDVVEVLHSICQQIWKSGPITANRWRNNGNSDRLFFLGSKTTVDCGCSHEIKRFLSLAEKL